MNCAMTLSMKSLRDSPGHGYSVPASSDPLREHASLLCLVGPAAASIRHALPDAAPGLSENLAVGRDPPRF